MWGITICLVTHEFSKTLSAKFPKGRCFKSTGTKLAAIKTLLPADADTKNYSFILCPNTLGIPAGETEMVKGSSDNNMAEHCCDLGKHTIIWLTIQTEGTEGVLPFSLALQTVVVANKVALDLHYPNTPAIINLTQSQLFTFISPLAEEDEDDAIYGTVAELKAQLQAATLRNTTVAASQVNPLGLNGGLDMDSIGGLGLKTAAASTGNTDCQEAKLHLTCASYCPPTGSPFLISETPSRRS